MRQTGTMLHAVALAWASAKWLPGHCPACYHSGNAAPVKRSLGGAATRAIARSTHRTTGRVHMRKHLLLAAAASVLLFQSAPAGAQTRTTLDIYVVDV